MLCYSQQSKHSLCKPLVNEPKYFLQLIYSRSQSYFTKLSFLFHLKNHHSKDVNLKFYFETVKPLGGTKQFRVLDLPIPFCVSLTMVTIITRHIFIKETLDNVIIFPFLAQFHLSHKKCLLIYNTKRKIQKFLLRLNLSSAPIKSSFQLFQLWNLLWVMGKIWAS